MDKRYAHDSLGALGGGVHQRLPAIVACVATTTTTTLLVCFAHRMFQRLSGAKNAPEGSVYSHQRRPPTFYSRPIHTPGPCGIATEGIIPQKTTHYLLACDGFGGVAFVCGEILLPTYFAHGTDTVLDPANTWAHIFPPLTRVLQHLVQLPPLRKRRPT